MKTPLAITLAGLIALASLFLPRFLLPAKGHVRCAMGTEAGWVCEALR